MSVSQLLRAIWEWLRYAGPAKEPERRSFKLMRNWLSTEQRNQFDARGILTW